MRLRAIFPQGSKDQKVQKKMADNETKELHNVVDENDASQNSARSYLNKFMDWTDTLFDIDNHRFLVGLNSAIVAAAITTSYRNPKLALAARASLPPICGVTAVESWNHFITKKLQNKELECSICAYMRGFGIAVACAAFLPATVGAMIVARGAGRGVITKAEKFTECFSENVIQRPIMAAAVLGVGGIGYIMASREFERALLHRLFKEK